MQRVTMHDAFRRRLSSVPFDPLPGRQRGAGSLKAAGVLWQGIQIMKTGRDVVFGVKVEKAVRVRLDGSECVPGVLVTAHVAGVSIYSSFDLTVCEARELAAELLSAAGVAAGWPEAVAAAGGPAPACYRRGEVGEYGPACSKCPFAACETCAHWNGDLF